ncbi:MAG: response regulator transcription factor [Alphaproteobacteria bacterium]
MKLLLVEDDLKLGSVIKKLLELEHFIVDWAKDGSEALELFNQVKDNIYDVVILDWMLPELSGIEVCKIIRRQEYQGGIIFLTAKDGLDDCVLGLETGADDYISKPFEIKELVARINAVYRRKAKPFVDKVILKQGIVLDSKILKVSYNNIDLKLSKKEFAIFEMLFVHLGKTILRTSIFERIWEDKYETSEASLDTHIYTLRKKIKKVTDLIKIELNKGVGYVMEIKDVN